LTIGIVAVVQQMSGIECTEIKVLQCKVNVMTLPFFIWT